MSGVSSIKYAASLIEVPFELLRAICSVESNLNPKAVNQYDGNSASHGLCQVKVSTAEWLGFEGSVQDLYDPITNAKYAALYLKYQLERYHGDWVKATSAYNRGTFSVKNSHYVTKVFNVILKEELNVKSRLSNKEYPGCYRKHANKVETTQ